MTKFRTINTTPFKFDTENVNPRFSKSKIYVMYHGENRNKSEIGKDSVDRNLYTIKNIPIVGEFKITENKDGNFGGHGGKIEIADGDIKYVHTTKPIGVIPETAVLSWEMVEDANGIEKEYLVVDGAYFWNRYEDEINALKEDSFGQSMEIEITKGAFDKDKQLYVIDDFVFSALCILGIDKDGSGHVEPCFEDAKVITYSEVNQDAFRSEFNTMLKELKFSLSDEDISKKEVNTMLEKLLEKYSITKEQLEEKIANFSELSEEELTIKVEEVFGADEPEINQTLALEPEFGLDPETILDQIPDAKDEEKYILSYELSHEDVRSKLYNLLEAYVLMHSLGSRWDFWLASVYDDYFVAIGDKHNYKISYTKTDDVITLGDYVEVFVQYLTAEEKASLDSTQSEFELVKEELATLKEFKENSEKAEHVAQADKLFAESKLEESEYEDIKSDVHSFSLDQIEEKLFARVGRKAINGKNFSKTTQTKEVSIHIPVGNSENFHKEQHPRYGDLFND
jgi:hypothetical protein